MPRRPKLTVAATDPSPQTAMARPPDGPRPPGTAWPAWLVMTYGPQVGQKFELDVGKTTIGQASDSDIYVTTSDVAERHASLSNDGEQVTLVTRTSEYPTFINEESVTRRVLEHDDEISIGRVRFRFLQHEDVHACYHEVLYSLSTVDPLTQVYNRRFFLETVRKELQSPRFERPVALARIDLDHFNRCNDAFGCAVGNQVLRAVARLLRQCTREGDVLGRYSGQQFCVFLPRTDIDTAMQVCEDMRESVERAELRFEGHEVRVTVSIGVANGPPTVSADELLDRSEAALHQAKRAGRNRIVWND